MNNKQPIKKPEMDSQGKFAKGNHGGAGRPKGSLDRRTAPFRAAIDKALPDILKTVIQSAKGGDMAAAKILMDKSLPNLKPIEQTRIIPLSGTTLTEKAMSMVEAAANGTVTTGDAIKLLSALESVTKIMEVDELIKRIEDIEKTNKAAGGVVPEIHIHHA